MIKFSLIFLNSLKFCHQKIDMYSKYEFHNLTQHIYQDGVQLTENISIYPRILYSNESHIPINVPQNICPSSDHCKHKLYNGIIYINTRAHASGDKLEMC